MSVYLAVDKDGTERIMSSDGWRPYVGSFGNWCNKFGMAKGDNIILPKGTIKKIIGKDLSFEDDLFLLD